MRLTRVDFPEPVPPMMPIVSPDETANETSYSAERFDVCCEVVSVSGEG